jgi:hypothetical protein
LLAILPGKNKPRRLQNFQSRRQMRGFMSGRAASQGLTQHRHLVRHPKPAQSHIYATYPQPRSFTTLSRISPKKTDSMPVRREVRLVA